MATSAARRSRVSPPGRARRGGLQLLTGTTTADGPAFVDIDDTIRDAHGYQKQGVAYGYSGVEGLNAQVATLSSPACAPVIAAARLRKGNVVSGHGGAKLVASSVKTARTAGSPRR